MSCLYSTRGRQKVIPVIDIDRLLGHFRPGGSDCRIIDEINHRPEQHLAVGIKPRCKMDLKIDKTKVVDKAVWEASII